MLYAILCYNSEAALSQWTPEEDEAVMTRHAQVMKGLAAQGKTGPTARLMPTASARTVRWPGCSRYEPTADAPESA